MSGLRPARPNDVPQLKELWKLVFGDTDELIDAFFELLYSDCRTAVIEEGGHIVAAAYAIRLENIRYIYAVATHPDHRGKGYGEAVTCAAAGGEPACLYPASEGLRGWYARRMGAESVSMAPCREAVPLAEITAEQYRKGWAADWEHINKGYSSREAFAARIDVNSGIVKKKIIPLLNAIYNETIDTLVELAQKEIEKEIRSGLPE